MIVFFDGVCNLCNAWVDWVIRHDRAGTIQFAPLQGKTAQAKLPVAVRGAPGTDPDSIIVYTDKGEALDRSRAILAVGKKLGGFWALGATLASFIPGGLRDLVYKWIARNRYRWFGQKETCRLPTQEERARMLE